MGTILEALAVIKGKDATGGAFDAVAQKIARISRAANALNRDVQKQLNLAAGAERAASRMQRASSAIGTGAKMAAGAAATYGAGRAVSALAHKTVEAGSDRAHEETRMAASGMTLDEIKHANELAASISKKYPSVSSTEAMHAVRNIRSVTGHFEEATKILDPLMQLRVVALGAHPEKAAELGEDFDKLIKGMEIKGVTQDLAKFNHYIDGMAKAVNVFGDTLRPTDYYEMFKYGRAATNALSDDFMLKTAPTLAQELGGSSAGKALSSFYTQFVGGKMSNKALAQLEEYGLLTDPSKVIKTSTGNVKGILPGAIMGQEYLQPGATDPYAWVNKVLIPQLEKKGVTDPAKIQEVIAAMASQQTTAQMMAIFATQQSRIEKDKHLVEGAKGVDAAELFQRDDPKVIRKSIEAQVDNVLANTTAPMMPAVNQGMNWLASGLAYAAEHAKTRPGDIAAGGGWLAAMTGALGLDGLGKTAELFTGRGGSLGLSKAVATMAPVLALTQIADAALDDDDINRLKRYEAGPRYRLDQLKHLADADKAAGIYGDPDFEADVRAKTAAKRAALEGELSAFGYNPAVTQGRYGGQGAPNWTVDDIRKATGIGGGEPVKAEVVGEATLKTEVVVSPSPDFLTRVQQTVQNGINAFRSSGGPATGSSGSTGRSMPEAGPPQ
ncbi:hypothetical protein EOW77_0019025 [Bradyrhizobium yuanmingense]|uniref:hypothetical protein n=1 Tax=Bradyrhizobium yuanmingense TaxID=108015 RepID=UPI000FE37D2C|nr:hypothetical protein [Bradyrhizobium yuanmingense]TGN86702.1 hypothetical protein EOW77_0019025 [Bradyrhizobium yuanmingense]